MPKLITPSKKILSVSQATILTGLSSGQVYRLIRKGTFKTFRSGNKIFISEALLLKYCKEVSSNAKEVQNA